MLTNIFHPNVDATGRFCVLGPGDMSPSLCLRTLIWTVCGLLDSPVLENPLNPEAAELFAKNKPEYLVRARQSVAAYIPQA